MIEDITEFHKKIFLDPPEYFLTKTPEVDINSPVFYGRLDTNPVFRYLWRIMEEEKRVVMIEEYKGDYPPVMYLVSHNNPYQITESDRNDEWSASVDWEVFMRKRPYPWVYMKNLLENGEYGKTRILRAENSYTSTFYHHKEMMYSYVRSFGPPGPDRSPDTWFKNRTEAYIYYKTTVGKPCPSQPQSPSLFVVYRMEDGNWCIPLFMQLRDS